MAGSFRVSYWVLPIISGLVWLGMLLGMLLHWIINDDSEHYTSMADTASIAYISNIGADDLKPLFIAGCCVTTLFLDLSFAAERWLRHRGRLVPNGSTGEKVLVALTIVFALVGTAGLVLLSIFDTAHYKKLHDIFLLLFIAGYLLSAIFICWEYQRLGVRYRDHRILRISFWVKLIFVLVEFCLAVAFASCSFNKKQNAAAVIEWIVALIFSFYVFSFIIDLWPAMHTKSSETRFRKPDGHHEVEEGSSSSSRNQYQRDYQMDTRPVDF
ncbi:Fc.00g053360.m01.CDS01 [Cosmosporella sp. VM-42]